MGDSREGGGKLKDSGMLVVVGKLMVVAVIILFLVVVFIFFLHIYAKWFWYRRREDVTDSAPTRRRRRRFDFAPGYQELVLTTVLRRGLDPAVLKSLPAVVYSARDFKEGLECAVCLCEVTEGERARLLPKCNHGFHVDCIDMWFQSHSTCPLCRNPVSAQSNASESSSTLETILQAQSGETSALSANESLNFPTNVLFWGDETRVSTLELSQEENHQTSGSTQTACSTSSSSTTSNRAGGGVSSIDIPRQINEEEETKSPVATRLRSLRRLLSRDKRTNPCSNSNVDLEQGSRS